MKRLALFVVLAVTAALPAAAQLRTPLAPVVTGRTPLRCVVDTVDSRLLHLTNTTGAAIAAETRLYIDAVHFGTNEHEVLFVYAKALAPGQVQDVPLWRATGCTAWLDTPATMAP